MTEELFWNDDGDDDDGIQDEAGDYSEDDANAAEPAVLLRNLRNLHCEAEPLDHDSFQFAFEPNELQIGALLTVAAVAVVKAWHFDDVDVGRCHRSQAGQPAAVSFWTSDRRLQGSFVLEEVSFDMKEGHRRL